jgi:DNA-directed RNA polymerase specialized sigma subunit
VTTAERDKLIELYLPSVRRLAGCLARQFPRRVERCEIESVATLALIEGIEAWSGEGDAWLYLRRKIRRAVEQHRRWVSRLPATGHDMERVESPGPVEATEPPRALPRCLPAIERSVLYMATERRMTRREIAATLGLSVREVARIKAAARDAIARLARNRQ